MPASKIGLLRRVSFFAEMSEQDLRQIDQLTTEKSYEAGEFVIQENTAAERFFIICQGKIQILKRFEDDEELLLAVHSDGEFFGEMALLDEGPRSASARAVEATTLLEISRQDFDTLLIKAPVLAFGILKALSTRLRETGALLVSHLQHKNRQLRKAYLETVRVVMQTMETREGYAPGHTSRVTLLAREIGRELGLSGEELFRLQIGALLHDVGKMGVPDELLRKHGPLAEGELEQVHEHAGLGKQLLEEVPYLQPVIPEVLSHHEHYDGTGYPESLSGADIPLPGRIVAVADTFDALLSDRPYRSRLPLEQALGIVRQGAGSHFDPQVVEALLKVLQLEPLRAFYPE